LITVEVGPNSHKVIYVPVKPLEVGQLLIRARPTDDNAGHISATSQIRREGYEVTKSSVLMIDLSNRPYFVGNIQVSVPDGYESTNELTMTGGIVGPILPKLPLNISSLIDQPQVIIRNNLYPFFLWQLARRGVNIIHYFRL
jgi:hypothetical protein